MSVAVLPHSMTTEEFLALPDDGVERWLIRGQLREKMTTENGMTVRNRFHSIVMARVSQLLNNWLDQQPEPHGSVLCGEAGVRLAGSPDSVVGIDVVYISGQTSTQQSVETTLIDGVPVLAVEILSPNDTIDQINEKIDAYLNAGVGLVWVIDPHRRTIEIIQSGKEPELVNVRQELTAEPHLPGFRVPAIKLFS